MNDAKFFVKKKKWEYLEQYWSQRLHGPKGCIPLLISSQILRRKGCGQIDLAYYDTLQDNVILCEIKTSPRMSSKQWMRLRRSANVLGILMNKAVILRWIVGFPESVNNDCFSSE